MMNRLKQTLIGAGALLATATVALVVLLPTQQDIGTVMYPPARHGSDSAIAAEGKVYRYCYTCIFLALCESSNLYSTVHFVHGDSKGLS